MKNKVERQTAKTLGKFRVRLITWLDAGGVIEISHRGKFLARAHYHHAGNASDVYRSLVAATDVMTLAQSTA